MGYQPAPIDEQLREVLYAVLDRRSRGEDVPDERVIAEHPHLMPRLAEELSVLRRMDLALLGARRGAIGAGQPPPQPTVPLSEEELEQPIVPGGDPEPDELPRVAYPVRPPGQPALPGYRILNEISSGGQAVVYKAVQEVTGRVVAVKVLTGGPLAGSRQRARFDREAGVLAGLSHPNVVGILDRGYAGDGAPYLVMDYVDGRSLDEWLLARPAIDDVLRLFVKLCDAVEAAHARGVAHRDLKPSNVRVDGRGEPHVLDFGLATPPLGEDARRRCVTETGQVVGSLPWASPEQATGGPADARSDVYAVGVMLYVALTGRFPYPVTGGPAEVVDHIVMAAPAAPGRLLRRSEPVPASLRRGLDAVVLKALRKRPAERYASAGALGRDLVRLAGGKAPHAARPRRWPAVVCVALVLGLIGAGGWRLAHLRFYDPTAIGPGALRPLPPPTAWPAPPAALTNSIGMRFVRIEPGEFMMGADAAEPMGGRDRPRHHVRITRPYLMAMTETTRGEFQAVMGGEAPDAGHAALPAVNVAGPDAEAFCRKLGQLDHRHYRLPTEAEWEYACRAGTTGPFAGDPDEMAWHAGTRRMDDGPSPVARKRPNAWGLYDMHGNVRERCADAYTDYTAADATNPYARPEDHPERFFRIARGGDYTGHSDLCRSARRFAVRPSDREPTLGFRVVLEPASD